MKQDMTATQNKKGEWVPAIPEPYYGIRKMCGCGKSFWTLEGYQAHYALKHIHPLPLRQVY